MLNLPLKYPKFELRLKHIKDRAYIFDSVRKKWVVLSPEEWVRQHLINYLTIHKKTPLSLISVEKEIKLNQTKKRYDVVIYNKALRPVVLIECKAPTVIIDNTTIEQALRYNLILSVNYLMLSNGVNDIILYIKDNKVTQLDELPDFDLIM